jgi:hypothetical protein
VKPISLYKWILIAIFFSISTHSRAQACLSDLPDSARTALEQDNWTIVQPHDLSEADLRVWTNNHPSDCPGVAVGNFSPKAKSSFIVALIQRDDQKNVTEKVVLVIMKKDRPETELAVTTMAIATPYVVWKLPRGRYLGIDGTKASISRNSFVYEKMVGPASQYYYDGSHLRTFVISR